MSPATRTLTAALTNLLDTISRLPSQNTAAALADLAARGRWEVDVSPESGKAVLVCLVPQRLN